MPHLIFLKCNGFKLRHYISNSILYKYLKKTKVKQLFFLVLNGNRNYDVFFFLCMSVFKAWKSWNNLKALSTYLIGTSTDLSAISAFRNQSFISYLGPAVGVWLDTTGTRSWDLTRCTVDPVLVLTLQPLVTVMQRVAILMWPLDSQCVIVTRNMTYKVLWI